MSVNVGVCQRKMYTFVQFLRTFYTETYFNYKPKQHEIMKKSKKLKLFSARTVVLMLTAMFAAGAQSQTIKFEGNGIPYKAVIDGTSDSDVNILPEEYKVINKIEYNRYFQIGVPATIVLPFPTTGMTVTGGYFYEFNGVEYNPSSERWEATMTEVDANNLERNTPYIIVPTASILNFDLNGNYVHAYTDAATVTFDCWAFVGTYKKVYWVDISVDVASSKIVVNDGNMHQVEVGDYYGFAANSGTAVGGGSVSAGEFVKCSGNGEVDNSAFILPMRAYLKFVGDENCYANNDTQMVTRSSESSLPTSIAVVLRNADGQVASVGTVSKETGEITFEGWFTLDGIKLSAEPTESGVFIHNGKKVVVK